MKEFRCKGIGKEIIKQQLQMCKDQKLKLAFLQTEEGYYPANTYRKLGFKDDMNKIYETIKKCDNIIIMSPIYMNQITGILKNVIDRFNPYCASEKLRGKKIF